MKLWLQTVASHSSISGARSAMLQTDTELKKHLQ